VLVGQLPKSLLDNLVRDVNHWKISGRNVKSSRGMRAAGSLAEGNLFPNLSSGFTFCCHRTYGACEFGYGLKPGELVKKAGPPLI